MATTIKTKFQLRYDTYQNWSTNNPTLLKGEIAVVAVPTEGDGVLQTEKPAILFKVGDGSSDFNTLPWASAKAADVYGWAKAETKPTYTHSEVGAAAEEHTHTKSEITDFPTKLSQFTNDLPTVTNTNTTYQIVANGTNSFKLQSKELDGDWTDVPDSVFTVDLSSVNEAISTAQQSIASNTSNISSLSGRVGTLEGKVNDLGNALHFVGAGNDASKPSSGKNGDVYIATDTSKEYVWSNDGWQELGSPDHLTKATADGYYDAKGSAESVKTELTPKITQNTTDISGLKDGTVAAGNASKLNGQVASYYATASALEDAKESITEAEGRLDAVEGKATTNASNITTLQGYFSDGKAKTAAVADSANSVTWANVSGKPSSFTPSAHTHKVAEISDLTTEIFVLDGGDSNGY